MMMMEAGVRWRCSSVLVVAPPPRSLSSSFAQTTPAPLSRRTRRRRRIGNLCVRAVAAPTLSTTDESGRLCSPRAGRELALSIIYAACLQGSSDPLHLFQNRINAPAGGYEFDKSCLSQYDHMSFGGPPVTVHTLEEQEELLRRDNLQSSIEAEVLSAPPKLVYSKFILRLANKLVTAVTQRWDTNVVDIEKVVPLTWKEEPAGRILELCILHLAMSEIVVLKTRHQIVINEAVDLAKRFCDGAAPRIINGCLRTFVKDREEKT